MCVLLHTASQSNFYSLLIFLFPLSLSLDIASLRTFIYLQRHFDSIRLILLLWRQSLWEKTSIILPKGQPMKKRSKCIVRLRNIWISNWKRLLSTLNFQIIIAQAIAGKVISSITSVYKIMVLKLDAAFDIRVCVLWHALILWQVKFNWLLKYSTLICTLLFIDGKLG